MLSLPPEIQRIVWNYCDPRTLLTLYHQIWDPNLLLILTKKFERRFSHYLKLMDLDPNIFLEKLKSSGSVIAGNYLLNFLLGDEKEPDIDVYSLLSSDISVGEPRYRNTLDFYLLNKTSFPFAGRAFMPLNNPLLLKSVYVLNIYPMDSKLITVNYFRKEISMKENIRKLFILDYQNNYYDGNLIHISNIERLVENQHDDSYIAIAADYFKIPYPIVLGLFTLISLIPMYYFFKFYY